MCNMCILQVMFGCLVRVCVRIHSEVHAEFHYCVTFDPCRLIAVEKRIRVTMPRSPAFYQWKVEN